MNNSHGTSAGPAPCSHLSFAVGDPDIRRYGLGAVALRLAAMGLPSFPLKPGGKEPVIPSAHPPGDPLRGRCHGECGRPGHGCYDATTDPAVITGPDFWGDGHKSRNIGIRTDRLLVPDLDVKGGEDGPGNFWRFCAERGLVLPPGPYAETPSGGIHLPMALPDGVTVQSRNGVLPGVDIKSAGGYIAVWPSAIRRRITPASTGYAADEVRYEAASKQLAVYEPYTWRGCPCRLPLAPPELIEALGALPGTSAGGGGHGGGGGGWTDPDIPALIAAGIPDGVTQRPVLRDVVFKLVLRGCADAEIRAVWNQITARTALTRPDEPWAEWHFRLQLDSARAKAAAPRTELPAGWSDGVQSLVSAGDELSDTPCAATRGITNAATSKDAKYEVVYKDIRTVPQGKAKYYAVSHHCEDADCQKGCIGKSAQRVFRAMLSRFIEAAHSPLTTAQALGWGPCRHHAGNLAAMASCEKCAAGRRADLRALEELEKHHQVRRDGDRVYPLRDPVRVYARVPCPSVTCDKEHDPHAWAGAPLDQVCPEAGGKWESAQLDEMYAAMWEASPDIKVTEALREFNDSHFRHVEGVPHLHYVSRQMITRARKRLREAGRLDRVAKPVLCRRADQYVTLERAVWDVRSGAAPERLASMRAHYIRVVQPDPARLAHRDAYAAHVLAITRPDFAALFQMADKTYQGAEPPPPAPAWWVQVPAPPPPRL